MQVIVGQTMMALLCVATAAGATEPGRRIVFQQQEGLLSIRVDDELLATYVYRDKEILRPYFKDVCAPGRVQVTRRHPPKEDADPADHATMHPGLWLAFGDLNGADFWRNKATVEHAGFVEEPRVDRDKGTFTVRNNYVAGGTVVCREVCTYTFLVQSAGCLILWDSTFQSEQSGLCFGDQEEMGLGVRVATPIMVKPYGNHSRPGRILNSEGRRDEKGTWGEPAAWCDYAGWVDDAFVGIMVMPDPRNVSLCRWHTRDYGLMVANPFARSAFKKGPANRTEVASGASFRLRFGILIHAARSEEGFDPAVAHHDYLEAITNGPDRQNALP
ncbi:MAG: PmoA family protein [Phycisphaerae bacterium]|nr:PmoA family protein [Phycisphaerae bacterium]